MNKITFSALSTLLFVAIFSWSACNDASIIGGDLVEGDLVQINLNEDKDFLSYSVPGDSLRVFRTPSGQLDRYLLGNMEDAFFGSVESQIYLQVIPDVKDPNLGDITIDSAVFVMVYDTTGLYGDYSTMFDFEVYRLTERPTVNVDFYSNKTFATESTPIGVRSMIPRPKDSIDIIRGGGVVQKIIPQLRIPLSSTFAQSLNQIDSSYFTTTTEGDDKFLDLYNGFNVRVKNKTKGLLSFDLETGSNGIRIYYKNTDNIDTSYLFPVGQQSVRMANYRNDFSTSPIASVFSDNGKRDEFLYLQGMGGPNVFLEFNDVSMFQNSVINKAELVFTQISATEEDVFTPSKNIVAATYLFDTLLSVIPDVTIALQGGAIVPNASFDGSFKAGTGQAGTYTMNITTYFQRLVQGETDPRLRLSVYDKNNRGTRVVLGGVGNTSAAPILRVYHTPY